MDGYGKRILVIEGDDGCRTLLEAQLEQESYAVQTACDGLAGLDKMRTRRFDAVIADSHMPGLNGLEFSEFCGITWPGTPIIFVSSDPSDLTDTAERYDAVARVRKPYEATLLLSLLHTATRPVSANQATFPIAQMAH